MSAPPPSSPGTDVRPTTWLLSLPARIALAVGYGVAIVLVVGGRLAAFETHIVGRALSALGEHRAISQASVVLVHPVDGFNFLLHISWSCSSMPVLAGVGAAGLLVRGTGWRRRLLGLAAASVLVMVGNFLRLLTTTEAAVRFGQGASLLWHDWAGTGLTLTIGAVAIWVCIHLAGSGRSAALVRT